MSTMPVNNWNDPNYRPPGAEITRLDSDSQTWLIVAVAGFFLGTMWVTGPLAWYQGNKLREAYLRVGVQPSQNADAARIIGMLTSILSVLILAFVCVMATVVFAAMLSQHR